MGLGATGKAGAIFDDFQRHVADVEARDASALRP